MYSHETAMKPLMATVLDTGKCTGYELDFLKSLGWIVESGWIVRGTEPVEIARGLDRWSQRIIDKRFIKPL